MPVIRPPVAILPEDKRDQLIERLAAEWGREGTVGEPLIIETPIGQTPRFRVVVIWREWEGVPQRVRDDIVREAYRRAAEAGSADPKRQPALSLAVTPDEAIRLDLLPWSIEAAEPSKLDSEAIRRAKLDAGAVQTRSGLLLRFASLEAARAALLKLRELAGEPNWYLVDADPAAAR